VRVVFVFADGEPGMEFLKVEVGASIKRLGSRCGLHVIELADHVFSQAARGRRWKTFSARSFLCAAGSTLRRACQPKGSSQGGCLCYGRLACRLLVQSDKVAKCYGECGGFRRVEGIKTKLLLQSHHD
jgi:hypothetical protein